MHLDDYFQDLLKEKTENHYYFQCTTESLVYILNSYPSDAYIQNRNEILIDVKNAAETKGRMYEFILKLIVEYQRSLDSLFIIQNDDDNNQFYQQIYNKILTFLNKIKTMLDS